MRMIPSVLYFHLFWTTEEFREDDIMWQLNVNIRDIYSDVYRVVVYNKKKKKELIDWEYESKYTPGTLLWYTPPCINK